MYNLPHCTNCLKRDKKLPSSCPSKDQSLPEDRFSYRKITIQYELSAVTKRLAKHCGNIAGIVTISTICWFSAASFIDALKFIWLYDMPWLSRKFGYMRLSYMVVVICS